MDNIEDVINANVKLHTAAADKYREEPHYRPESRARIREIIQAIQRETKGKALLDVGCGMGFIIDIAREFFEVIRGVDVTPAMLERVNTSDERCNIKVEIARVECLPFENNTFDVCTAHALLHHLKDIRPALKEIRRVLRPGGIFYSDLDPNGYFREAIKSLGTAGTFDKAILREINAAKNKDQEIADLFNLDVDTVQKAEHWMHVEDGFKEEDLRAVLDEMQFSQFEVKYQWFLGEAGIIHGEQTMSHADVLRTYLHDMFPLTRHLFKYLSIIARK